MRFIVFILSLALVFGGCKDTQTPTPPVTKEPLIEKNKSRARQENDRINAFVERKGWNMVQTGTGLRYMVYESGNGQQAENGKTAFVRYTISLLNGKVCYETGAKEPRPFLIGQDHVESGIHEGILFLKVGDKARFILPSHLAFGLTGDGEKIPPHSAVVYDLELVDLK